MAPGRAAEPPVPAGEVSSTVALDGAPIGAYDDPFAIHLDAGDGRASSESVEQCPIQFAERAEGGSAALDFERDPFGLRSVHVAAAHGIRGAGAELPHLDTIQASFGPHDVRGVSSHVGGDAANASTAMGAEAYATGNHVAFRSSPDLHTAAHEAAHVVQQRAGVQLRGGVGQGGDPYEQHADEVADRVVRREDASGLLDAFSPSSQVVAMPVQMKPTAVSRSAIPYELATSALDAYLAELKSGLERLQNARGMKQHEYVRSVANLVLVSADKVDEAAHSIQAQHLEDTAHPQNVRAEATAPVVANARALANRTIEQLDSSDRARDATADLRDGTSEPKSVEELKERARRVANLGICDERDTQGSAECPLDENARALARERVKLSLVVAASNWNDAIQDKHQEVLREQPEAVPPIVDILISVAIGRLFAAFAAFKGGSGEKANVAGDGDGIGGVAQGQFVKDTIKDLTKEVSNSGKKRLSDAVKAGMGGSAKDAKISLLELIRPTIEQWRDEMGHALHHLPDADLVRIAEKVIELQASFTVEAFRANVDATLERFGKQVLSIGTGSMIQGSQLAWVFDPVSGERSRRLALIVSTTKTVRYRREDYESRAGSWTFVQWVDDDMAHPAIDRSASNHREILDLQAPGGATVWSNPDAVKEGT